MECIRTIDSRRSIRKFQRKEVSPELLRELVRCAGMAASGMNVQPVKYIIASGEKADEIFPHTRYAGYLKGKGSPSFEERPSAFILVLNDDGLRPKGYEKDVGAAVQNMLLAACSLGIGTCWLGAIDYDEIRKIADIPEGFTLVSAVAVGYPAQKSITEQSKGDIKYYLDKEDVLHVPKRTLDELIVKTY
jgi:nitroreductase